MVKGVVACVLLALLGSAVGHPRPYKAGGARPLDLEDKEVKEKIGHVVDFYVSTIQDKADDNLTYEFVKIHSATQQIVAGINYHLELELNKNGVCEMRDIVVYKDIFGDRNITSDVTSECDY